jgi:hypothetical protein
MLTAKRLHHAADDGSTSLSHQAGISWLLYAECLVDPGA